ncbi:MAG: AAA family ATPase [Candidatus Aenigmatarchaeota archaeon]|nr:MAG: AAA family ATPase [Candidatus Aenigmarchaeota archaeon]
MDRISTGVDGLDAKMEGGFFPGSSNLLVGKTGTGKTIFASSFLYKGSLQGEPGVYVATEQREDDVKSDVQAMFGWDFRGLEAKKLLKFVSIKPSLPTKGISQDEMARLVKSYIYNITDSLINAVNEVRAKRIVLDSVSFIEMFVKDEYLVRAALMQMVETLKEAGVTAVFTGMVPEESEALSGGGIVEYLVDTVIKMEFVPVAEEFKRTLTIRKMRRTNHSTLIHPIDITKDGLRVIEIK